jgi:sulfur-oxidizing protein SoxY
VNEPRTLRHPERRAALKASSALMAALAGIGLIGSGSAAAQANAFAATSVDDVFKALGATPAASTELTVGSPDIAENGAVVQVGITSKLAKTTEIHLLVEKNPMPLVASMSIPEGTESFVQLRAKMGQTTTVWALIKADGKWYSASKETKVTLGGCGG